MVIVITGASSGLGEYLAVELGRRGHALGLVARRREELDRVAGLVRTTGARCEVAPADVLDRDGLRTAIHGLADTLGPIDVLVANAGGGDVTPATRLDAARFNRIMHLNVDGVINAFEAVLPAMIARKSGQIAAVSSVAGRLPMSPSVAYSASKAAVTITLDAFRGELAPYGIAVTNILPGFVKTPLTAKNKHPMPFILEPEDAARRMANGLLARRSNVVFPFVYDVLTRFGRWLPNFVFTPIWTRLSPSPRPEIAQKPPIGANPELG